MIERGEGNLTEIRLHGRGGQGTVVCSLMLARAAMLEGRSVQSFPEFGVERRGAPVNAYLRISDRPIRLRCRVYLPDHVLVLDPQLLDQVELPPGRPGWLVVNTASDPASLPAPEPWRAAAVDATRIARGCGLGGGAFPIVNSAMAGAFARVTKLVGLPALLDAIREFAPSGAEQNAAAAREAWQAARLAPARRPEGRARGLGGAAP
jgi:2-oxoacid:acceptor oxidoreductase gamma subunit (pyruvate/2-ketoisovalerate family)